MSSIHNVEQEIGRIASYVGGTVGVSVLHVESRRRIGLNAGRRFPMASTYKVPIVVHLLDMVEREQIALDRMIAFGPDDLCPGSGMIKSHLYHPGAALSVRNLMEMMLIISDNTATDILIDHVGGPADVTAFLRSLGIEEIRVDRPTRSLIADCFGLSGFLDGSLQDFQERLDALISIPELRRVPAEAFRMDPRDTSTPDAMVSLLDRLYRGELLKTEHSDLLLGIMQRCRTGASRLKGMLPFGTVLAHKTGTLRDVVVNDVGIITLPEEAGHLAVAVFVESAEKTESERERVIAHIARAAYDFFLFGE